MVFTTHCITTGFIQVVCTKYGNYNYMIIVIRSFHNRDTRMYVLESCSKSHNHSPLRNCTLGETQHVRTYVHLYIIYTCTVHVVRTYVR